MAGAAIALIGLAFIGAFIGCVVFVRRWRAEQAESQRVRATFARYVPPAIVEELLGRKDERIFTGREMRATILVCRIWNFSHFIEKLTPEQTLRYLNEFYAMAGSSIERQHGVLHRFLEDGVVGIFGVPLEDPNQEDHALRAAINMVRLVAVMQEKWAQQNRRPFRVGVGINTGDVIAGDAGFAQRREYTVVGPDVTLAHRLAAGTVDLNVFIIASRATIEPVVDLYNLIPVSGVPLNGVRALLDAFIVNGRKRGDNLVLPKAEAFAHTVLDDVTRDALAPEETVPIELAISGLPSFVDPPEPAPPQPAPAVASTADAASSSIVLPAPARGEVPEAAAPLKTRRRPRPPEAAQFGFDLPELRMPSFGGADEAAILPDPPPPRATYEDNDGPPLPL